LTIYKTIVEDIRTKGTQLDVPIYVNPEVDIIYRGKAVCRKGDAFRVRCRGWEEGESEPVSGTRILAVDTIALRVLKPWKLYDRHLWAYSGRWKSLLKHAPEWLIERFYKTSDISPASKIAKCGMRGVREVMVVVGNDDDLSEVTLVPFDKPLGERSAREQKAFLEVCYLRRSVERYWAEQVQATIPEFRIIPAPAVTLMTVKRAPLKYFTRFPDLPVEIQHMIWKFAYKRPRMLTLAYSQSNDEIHVLNCRQPAMIHACRAARSIAMKGYAFVLEHADYLNYWNSDIDSVRLLCGLTKPRTFSGIRMPSLAIPSHCWALGKFTGADAKLFSGLEEIVLLVGSPVAGCEVELIPILDEDDGDDVETDKWFKGMLDFQIYEAIKCASRLEKEMQSALKKWKTYQRSRVKKGKSSPDWIMPRGE
jgi:hypothetical protein